MIVTQMIMTGSGALQIAFERLKQRLEKEGLFASKNKKPIPTFPKTIGVITSPSGAAIWDILKVLKRRFPNVPIIVYPLHWFRVKKLLLKS
ncbi:exodeoxyribonuclease VII large subunit [Candidatus Coxiella mudrowiae]|uniref:exodeoxyribonuclease VII large subunit n=1 Tax=Candidatus Coxiella mudrowiae TaxID=2054173 RepID=UPI0027D3085A|nr:exodeoxyribonuclease VII large subunit [Candidatus Coxiella mudrowiae]